MGEDLKVAIRAKLTELFPEVTIYEEDLPEGYQKPAFLVTTTNAVAGRGLGGRKAFQLSFDISYYSNLAGRINTDCYQKGLALLEGFRLTGYRLKGKKSAAAEGILHFTFETQFTVTEEISEIKMKQKELSTNMKED
ncbi:hypothetical protein SAMN02745136_02429 [Anaerocolumna jejuensis DSM 15929]|uniref:Phage protein n=1 Tax=Anaerocolumna jejuensis DSM 15929 TaxID=1121322 RepID=A0A1M6S739_9FIRM|nr:hypothetical protein [Anaerocolumna jejuensis]SHK40368.1 hypothetical protein SAMN02745136_02429 [Anaerocolumna jejuensis DSM 15929]